MKSERMPANQVAKEEAAEAVADTLNVAVLQREQERKNIFKVLGMISIAVIFLLLIESSIGVQRGHDAAGGAHRHAGCVLGLGRRQPALALRPCQPTRGRAQRSFGVFGRQAAPMARKTTQPA